MIRALALHRLLAAPLLTAVLAAPGVLCAQTVTGHVLDELSADPVEAAVVMLLDSTDAAVDRTETDSSGGFVLEAPRTGTYRVRTDRMAYSERVSEVLALGDAGPYELLVRLSPLPVEVEGLLVEAEAEARRLRLEREGFYRRQEWAPGYFVDEEEILKWKPTFVSDMLQRVPGVRVVRGRGEARVFSRRMPGRASNIEGTRNCQMKVVLDGFPVPSVGGDLDFLVDATRVVGMEIYPSPGGMGAPVQHRGPDAFCGILMIWTR